MPFIGLDIGTSAAKAVLTDDAGAVFSAAEQAIETDRPRPGWSEQHPDVWWRATVAVLARLKAAEPAAFAATAGIGLSGQMHGMVLLGAEDGPLAPAILWNDGRAAAEAGAINAALPEIGRVAGVPAMAGLGAPKLLWTARHRPDVWSAVRRLMMPKDFVRLALTGEAATDPCDAAGSLLLDEAQRDWWRPVVDFVGLDPAALPRIVEGPSVSGRLRAAVAAELGLVAGIPVAGGAGDAAAGAIGLGAVSDGDAFISLGTSCQVFVTADCHEPYPEALVHAFAHGLPRRWFRMAALLNGASTLAWAAGVLGETDIARLLDRVAARGRKIAPVTFLPYLSGERTPHDDPAARGVLFGLSPETEPEDVVQAVLEGVALSIVDAVAALDAAATPVADLAIVGGGARSRLWTEIIASALGRPIRRYRGAQTGPALGAAMLARIAATGAPIEAVCRPPPILDVIDPDPERRTRLADRIGGFRDLYRALRPAFTGPLGADRSS